MSANSTPEPPSQRAAKRNALTRISPGLRKDITEAAEEIRAAHASELVDTLRADRAARLFSSLIRRDEKPAGSLADDVGGLVSDAIRAGTGLLEGSLTILSQAWMATIAGPPAPATRARNVSARASVPVEPAPEAPTPSAEEAMLRGVLRQFMPMLLTALNQGGDGYGLAKTVITLFGRPTYDQAAQLGKDKIMQLVKAEPDLWAQVAPIEDKFGRFLEEFVGYGAIQSQQ